MRALAFACALCACRGGAAEAVAPPLLAVSLAYEGAEPAAIESAVVVPVEQAVAAVPGVASIESRIEAGHATVNVELEPRADLERAAHELQHVLANVQLPPEAATPVIERTRRNDAPVLLLAVRGTLPIGALSRRVRAIAPKLEQLAGVMRVELRGIAEETIVVRPDPARLAATSLTVFDILAALQSARVDLPAGRIEGDAQLRVESRPTEADVTGELVVKQGVRLRDLATVEIGLERSTKEAPAIAIYVHPQSDRAAVAKTVRTELPRLREVVQLDEVPVPVAKQPVLRVMIRGPELGVLRRHSDAIAKDLTAAKIEFERDPPEGSAERTYTTDREQMAKLGIPIADVAATLRAFGGAHAGTLTSQDGMRDVIVRVPLDAFEQLMVRTQQGALVPLSSVVTATAGTSQTILRRDRERAMTLAIFDQAATARTIAKQRAVPPGYRVIITP